MGTGICPECGGVLVGGRGDWTCTECGMTGEELGLDDDYDDDGDDED